ncbi:MAG: hypothetical protein E4G99_12880 [Anaerolineales bacterium]|nr:MAG: hypothetical protein E4G99_12880 [Anaerolineales bacterium]
MKKRWMTYLWIALVLVTLLTACGQGSEPGVDDLESYAQAPEVEYDAPGFAGQAFSFSMKATSEDNQGILDSIDSDWVGTFMIDEDGQIQGQGSVLYSATIFAADDKGCGYRWVEDGGFDYVIGGKVYQTADGFTLPFLIDNAHSQITSVLGAPEATCADPAAFLLKTPPIYFDLHRDILISDVIRGSQKLGQQITVLEPLVKDVGKISYTIRVELEAVPLAE